MKVDARTFQEFIKKIPSDMVVLDFMENGIFVEGTNKPQTVAFNLLLKHSAFMAYESLGKIGITDMNFFSRQLEIFRGTFDLSRNENCLIFDGDGMELKIALPDLQYFKCQEFRNFDFDWIVSLEIEAERFKQMIAVARLFRSSVIKILTEDGWLVLKVDNITNDSFTKLRIAETDKNINVSVLVNYLDEVFKNLYGAVIFSIATNNLLRIQQQTEHTDLTYIVVPKED